MGALYLDNNATTPMRPEARSAWLAAVDAGFGNPSSLHGSGRRARQQLDEARERVAAALAVHEDEVLFTSGGTESNNLALQGVLHAVPAGASFVTSVVEHSSVLATAGVLGREGYPCRLVAVDKEGTIDVEALAGHARELNCRLVSVMAANNEIGTCMPLATVGERLKECRARPVFHTDAVQALGRVPVLLREWGIDLASFSAHKLGGPLGVGVLYRRLGVELRALNSGGAQEAGLRPGTENVPGILAAAVAIELAVREQAELALRLRQLSSGLWEALAASLPTIQLLGLPLDHARRLPGTLNILTAEHDGKVLVMRLDLAGLECSAGSACASGSLEPSHVLLALGLDDRAARTGLRLSFGRESTWADSQRAVDILRTTLGSAHAKRVGGTGL